MGNSTQLSSSDKQNCFKDADATRRISTKDADATVCIRTQDADATMRATPRLSSKLYLKAVQQSNEIATQKKLAQVSQGHQQILAVRKSKKKFSQKKRIVQIGCPLGLLLLLALLVVGAMNAKGTPHAHQQTAQKKATEQFQLQAEQDMQNFQTTLSRGDIQGVGNIGYFSQQFSQDQFALSSAHDPKDYTAISNNAQTSINALHSMASTFNQLTDFNHTITSMKLARLDVTAMQTQYENDVQFFNSGTTSHDFQNLSTQIDAQYQQTVVNSIQAFPYIGITKLNELETQIHQLKTYGMNTTHYQARLTADQVAVEQAKTVYDDLVFFKQIDGDIASMHSDLTRGGAHYLVNQFHHEVDAWAKAHPYHDRYDGHAYALDNGYMSTGIGSALDGDLNSANTTSDFEAMIDEANNALFNLHMLEADYNDHTPYNRVHATDLQMINDYKLQKKQLLVVSLVEQVMRVYQDGKLVNTFYVTTGRQELPSPPGVWTVLNRKSPIIFTSGEPKNSPYWFPDTPISYAILYHWGGDFVHDAPWRASFGPGTQFPHHDAGGNTAYNFDGSHGCINLQESDAAWVYKHTDWNTVIVVY